MVHAELDFLYKLPGARREREIVWWLTLELNVKATSIVSVGLKSNIHHSSNMDKMGNLYQQMPKTTLICIHALHKP